MPRASDRIGISATSGKFGRQLGQVERQAGAHHDRVDAAGAGLANVVGIRAHRSHHVHRQHAAASGDRLGRRDFAIEGDEIRAVDRRRVAAVLRRRHEVGVMAPQVDARDRSHRALGRDAAGEPVGGDAHAHAALHDRQQRASTDDQWRQPVGARPPDRASAGGHRQRRRRSVRGLAWLRWSTRGSGVRRPKAKGRG